MKPVGWIKNNHFNIEKIAFYFIAITTLKNQFKTAQLCNLH